MTSSGPNLHLYKFDSCPFCVRVMDVIDDQNIKVVYKDIMMEPDSLSQLIADTGKRTVPCLYIDGKPMFESADIINWLTQNSDNLEKNS